MLTVTAGSIITQARSAANAETSTPTTDFVTDTELYLVLTRAIRALTDLIIAEDGGIELLLTSATLTSPYALPSDFYRHAAVEIPDTTVSSTPWRALKEFTFRERNDFGDNAYPRYRIVGGTLTLSPSTAAPSSIQLWYVPVPTAVSLSTDVTRSVNGWEDYLIAKVAAYICEKEDRDPSVHQSSQVEAMARIRDACRNLAVADTLRVADVQRYPEEYIDLLV